MMFDTIPGIEPGRYVTTTLMRYCLTLYEKYMNTYIYYMTFPKMPIRKGEEEMHIFSFRALRGKYHDSMLRILENVQFIVFILGHYS